MKLISKTEERKIIGMIQKPSDNLYGIRKNLFWMITPSGKQVRIDLVTGKRGTWYGSIKSCLYSKAYLPVYEGDKISVEVDAYELTRNACQHYDEGE